MISKITKVLIALGLIGSIAACQQTGGEGGDQTTPEGGTPTEEPADGGTGTETPAAPEGGGTEGGQ